MMMMMMTIRMMILVTKVTEEQPNMGLHILYFFKILYVSPGG